MSNQLFNFEEMIFYYIDELKFLLFPDKWGEEFLDYSKNEILALLFLYKSKAGNMTEISEYINAPLNTTTGVINRLEKKEMVERRRDEKDRRIVNILLTDKAQKFIEEQKKVIQYYFEKIYNALSVEEKSAALGIFNKVIAVMKQEKYSQSDKEKQSKKVKRIIIE
ncbi:MarR family transcriptional regulator [Clostridium sp. YIM B02505]|uniref:MarR family transcriptional regulator n=1 Tax=Clostridium yunnanense TaxID=2800325 RepID=A0ABS1EKH0_9CLOT|nr:MarR family transcriptional regulator [Clostridium yunnanense]MBK1809833.1 MarR family transcriptional regulator [Clostridium yunnanense]